MSLAAKMRRAPLRIATGAFILNAGIGKLGGDDDTPRPCTAWPRALSRSWRRCRRSRSSSARRGEVALGGALLLPIVPAGLAGLGLTGFAGGLLGMWWRTPGMHAEGSPRPTQQGTAVAKDVWMLGIGTSLVIDAALTESKITGEQSRADAKATIKADAKAARKATKRAAKRARKQRRKPPAKLAAGPARRRCRRVLPADRPRLPRSGRAGLSRPVGRRRRARPAGAEPRRSDLPRAGRERARAGGPARSARRSGRRPGRGHLAELRPAAHLVLRRSPAGDGSSSRSTSGSAGPRSSTSSGTRARRSSTPTRR